MTNLYRNVLGGGKFEKTGETQLSVILKNENNCEFTVSWNVFNRRYEPILPTKRIWKTVWRNPSNGKTFTGLADHEQEPESITPHKHSTFVGIVQLEIPA